MQSGSLHDLPLRLYVMNRMGEWTTGDLRAFQLIMPVYQALAAQR